MIDEQEAMRSQGITLYDLWESLRDRWRYVIGGAILGLVAAATAIVVLPPKYEAVAIVQVGQVGQVGQAGPAGQAGQTVSLPVEQPAQSVERIKTLSFQLVVAKALGDGEWIDSLSRSSAATSEHLSVQVVKATSSVPGAAALIELRARSDDPGRAKAIAEVSIAELAKRQTEIARPMIDKMGKDLSIAKEKLSSAERELDGLSKMMLNVSVKDERFTQLSLITSLRVEKEAEVFTQRQAIMALETALMPPFTQPAKALEAVFVANTPISPKRGLLLELGGLGGLLAGVILVFLIGAWQRAKRGRAVSQAT